MIQTIVSIEGMMCAMCEAHISETIRKTFPGAKKVKSSRVKKQATFLTEDAVDPDLLRDAIEGTGYHFLSAESIPYDKKFPMGLFGLR